MGLLVAAGEAADPADGTRLGGVARSHERAERVVLDMAGVRGMNSAFSNAFWLAYLDTPGGQERPAELTSATDFQRRVFERSRVAVLGRLAEERAEKAST
ncbi:MAG: hypothetical protein FJ102_12135 [Deltaproteobacteria bacterium]|nr:hypothetical protein [Deltaproteobacteria bacterium]